MKIYIESGVRPPNGQIIRTNKFKDRYDRRWAEVLPVVLNTLGIDDPLSHWDKDTSEEVMDEDESFYRRCRTLCYSIYVYKEHKWISKHTFMLFNPLILKNLMSTDGTKIYNLPSAILRQIFRFLYGGGP